MSENKNAKVAMIAGAQLAPINPTSFDEVTRLAKLAVMAGMFAAKAGADETEDDKEAREAQGIARATMAIMQGLEVGIPAMQAVQNIAIINGRAMIYGDLLTAVLWRQGFKIRKWIEGDGDSRVGHAEVVRPDGAVIAKSFSVAQAKQARLWDTREKVKKWKKGGESWEALNDSPWFRFPDRMLEWRAFGFAVKDGASDAARGMLVYEEAAPESNQTIDITPPPTGPSRSAVIMDELPDIPDGTEDTPSAETGHPQTDAEFLAGFRHVIELHHRDPGMLQTMRQDWREAIAERGLEQQCEDIIASITGADAIDAPAEPDDAPDIPWETAETAPEIPATLGSEAATAAVRGLEMRLGKVHNATLVKEVWRNFQGVFSQLAPDAQALAIRARDAALARVKRPPQQAAE